MCDVDWGAGALLVSFGQCAHSVVLSYLYIYIRLCMRACVCVCVVPPIFLCRWPSSVYKDAQYESVPKRTIAIHNYWLWEV